jgi:hypothetical protein
MVGWEVSKMVALALQVGMHGATFRFIRIPWLRLFWWSCWGMEFGPRGENCTVQNAERPGPKGPGRSLVCSLIPYGWITSRSV